MNKFKGFISKERTQIDDLNFHLKKKVKKKKKKKRANQTQASSPYEKKTKAVNKIDPRINLKLDQTYIT